MKDRSTLALLVGSALSLLLFLPSPLHAGSGVNAVLGSVSAPAVHPLRAYRDGLLAPARIATDAAGHVYITDYALGQIIVRDEFGQLVSVKKGLKHPLGIAVDAAGRIYVGEEGPGSVSVFLPNWSLVGKLGRGAGEFQMPNHIEIPADPSLPGMVIVSDSRANLVKMYSLGGSLIRQFGGPGTAYGQFDFPTGVFVNTGGELFVADQNNNRIQVFSTDGTFLRSFGRSTFMGLGPFSRTQGLTGDSQGRIYVADAFQGTVKVIDAQGNAISTVASFGDGPGELRAPASLVIDRNKRLFVVSPGNTRVEVLGLDNYSDPKIHSAIITLRPSTFERNSHEANSSDGHGARSRLSSQVLGSVRVVGAAPEMIVLESITANGVPAQRFRGTLIGDFDGDGFPELRIQFGRNALLATLPDGNGVVVVKGMLGVGQSFEGSVPVFVKPGGRGEGASEPANPFYSTEPGDEPEGGPR